MNFYQHDTAIIDSGAIIGSGSKIWHWVHVSSTAVLGKNVTLGQNVYIGSVTIGDNVKIQNNVSVYDRVVIEDDVFCGPSMVFTNVINPRAAINRKSEFKSTIVRKGATLGANSTIICGITIGKYSMIGAGSVVTQDIKDFSVCVGVPAKQIGWICKCGINLDCSESMTRSIVSCEKCDAKFVIENNICKNI